MMQRSASWGAPAAGPPDVVVQGSDADLAAAVREHPGALIELEPDDTSDLARAVGIAVRGSRALLAQAQAGTARTAVPLDVLELDDGLLAVNAAVIGRPPSRLGRWARRVPMTVTVDGRTVFEGLATTVVVASGEYLDGADVVPRSHPGDGRADVQVYALEARERRSMRERLPRGEHVPHPRITQRSGREVTVEAARPLPFALDGRGVGERDRLAIRLRPGACSLLI